MGTEIMEIGEREFRSLLLVKRAFVEDMLYNSNEVLSMAAFL